jgi:cytochrome c553
MLAATRHVFCATLLAVAALVAGAAGPGAAAAEKLVDFTRQVRPLLSDRCFTCHGPDEAGRRAGLRLDVRQEAIDYGAILPGEPDESLMIERVAAEDADMRMPPVSSNRKPLTADEVDVLRRWIQAGAKYDLHWSYVVPRRPALPEGVDAPWLQNPIDRFVAAARAEQGLKPSPEADRRTLARRLSFDLTGLPPEPGEVERFVNDGSPDAYEKLVDRLLSSSHYGERMAVYWLDVVRYADTGGYHSDNHRDLWMYRDWVIEAFNQNKPYDVFVTEQLAGDLVEDATVDQRVASGYNRLLQTTEEGGAQGKEYTAKYSADRSRNTGAAFLAATTGCAECHDHKFDPISQKDFYRFAAFFADVSERAVGRQPQTQFPSPEQAAQKKKLDEDIARLRETLNTQTPELDRALAAWEREVTKDKEADAYKKLHQRIKDILAKKPGDRDEKQKAELAKHFRRIAPELEPTRKKLAEVEKERKELDEAIPSTLVTTSANPRTVRVLPRGNWLDDSGEVVEPGVPGFLTPALDTGDRRATRLDLARWMTSRENPLTARVFVNRLWYLLFGRGLVASLDDFGSQGGVPSHPELLDWLAVDFTETGWDVKRLVRQIVTSRTYRQASSAPEPLRQKDPENRWLARQGRFRLDAEFVRDNALAVSGLLVPKLGGPSVKPYQPAGYWQHLNFPRRTWVHDKDEDQWRRGLYTYWQRTFLHPSLAAFDAPSREECTANRPRSNTPLQALALLNDPTYVEAARALAQRAIREGGADPPQRIAYAVRRTLQRDPEPEETELLAALYEKHREQYAEDKAAAEALVGVGESKPPRGIDPVELAAWTSVARVVLNLHEAITRY